MNDNSKQLSPQALEVAFSIFNQASAELTEAYHQLQQQVSHLTAELAATNGELRRQLQEKDALSARLSSLLDALPGGVVVLNEQGQVIDANPTACTLLGQDLIGKAWEQLHAKRLRGTHVAQEYELVQEVQGAPIHRVCISSSPFVAGEQILLIQDITEAHVLQKELERHRRLSSMGEMAASLAHQLRTPLSTALLYTAHLGQRSLSDADRARFSERAVARLRHLEGLIQNMLHFVKGQAVQRCDMSLDELLVSLEQTLRPHLEVHKRQFAIINRAAGSVINAEREALLSAVLSLLDNAVQATPPDGRIVLLADIDRDRLVLTVEDNGKGIAPDIQERLFEPFFTTRTDGTGLGLAIVHQVARSHAGTVEFTACEGGGSRFSLRLPLVSMA